MAKYNMVVQSQAERSQHRNRENALRILRSRLFVHLKELERQKTESRENCGIQLSAIM